MNRRMRKLFDSDDFVQAVWASFIRIRPKLSNLDDSAHFIRLLARMACHSVIDEVRRGQKTPGPPPPHFPQRHDGVFQPEEVVHLGPPPSQYAMARERWKQFVATQPERNRKILELRISGETYRDIARKLGISERTVRRVVQRTLKLRAKSGEGKE
jgi:RNA polymerase sigma factor (sigma-70 family)